MHIKTFIILIACVFVQACATSRTTTHYGFFEAENSVGELRQFRIHWESTEVQSWQGKRRLTGPLILQAQCSERAIRLYDAQFKAQTFCMPEGHDGIVYCGKPSLDIDHRALPIEEGKICAFVTDRRGARYIKDLRGDLMFTMRCRPKEPKVRLGRKWSNRDLLKPSKIPYAIATKSLPGKESDGHIPELWNHSSVCDPNQGR